MVMPRAFSRSMASSICADMSRSATVPVRFKRRSDSVVFPWSIWAMMLKLRIWAESIVQNTFGSEFEYLDVDAPYERPRRSQTAATTKRSLYQKLERECPSMRREGQLV